MSTGPKETTDSAGRTEATGTTKIADSTARTETMGMGTKIAGCAERTKAAGTTKIVLEGLQQWDQVN